MKTNSCLLSLTLAVVLGISPSLSAVLVNFDDQSPRLGGSFITNSYQGLSWSNFAVANPFLVSIAIGYLTGYNYGMVTPSNVAFNAFGYPAEIDARGTNFNFLSAYLTGAWNSNLNIQVQGFRSGVSLYDTTVIASATNATLFSFDYFDIDRLYFNSFGGQPAFGAVSQYNFVMDNFTFEFVPEPSVFLLTGAGVLLLCAFHKRNRT